MRLPVVLILALIFNLSSPLWQEGIQPLKKSTVIGQNDVFEVATDEFLYQTKNNKYLTAKFGDKTDKYRHRLYLEQKGHALELALLSERDVKFFQERSVISSPTPTVTATTSPTPPLGTSVEEIASSSSSQLATDSAKLSTQAAELVEKAKTQLADISKHLSTISAEIEKISQQSAKIAKQVKNITGKTQLSFEENKMLVKNNQLLPGVDIAYQVIEEETLKQSIILKDKQQLKTLLANAQLTLNFALKLKDLVPNRDQHGNWRFRSKKDNSDVFTIPSPILQDAAGATSSAQFELVNPQSTATVTTELHASIVAPTKWLIDEQRVYPIIIRQPIKANRENIEHNPATALRRNRPINTTIVKTPQKDFPAEKDYNWQVQLPVIDGGILFHQFDQADTHGGAKVIHEDGWFVSFKLEDSSPIGINLVGNQIKWQSWPGLISRYTSLPDRLKADYIVDKREALEGANHDQLVFTLHFNDEPATDEEEVFLGKGFFTPKQNDDWTISFIAENNQEIFKLPLPQVVDAEGQKTTGSFAFQKTAQGTGRLAINLPSQYLDSATYPLTIDPTILDTNAKAIAITWGSGHSIIRTVNGKLVACWADNAISRTVCRASDDDGATWGTEATTSTNAVANRPAIYFDQTDGNVFHLAVQEKAASNDLYYYKGSLSGTTISFSTGLIIDEWNKAKRPVVITDTENKRPAVAWIGNSASGAKRGKVRFMRCKPNGTPPDDCTEIADWCNAAGTNCGIVATKTSAGSADELGSYTAAHTNHSVTLRQMPGTGTRSKDFYFWWIIDATDTVYYNYADWDGDSGPNADWTLQTDTTEDSTISTGNTAWHTITSARDETNNKLYFAYRDENGANDNLQVYERDTSNTKTSRGAVYADSRATPGTSSLVVDGGTIYAFYEPDGAGLGFNINSSGTTWSATQVLGTDSDYHIPNLHPVSANNKLYLQWRAGPSLDSYTIDYSIWHTDETRAVSTQTSLPSDDSITLTGADDFFFDEQDYVDTNSSNNVYDSGRGVVGDGNYIVYYFKDTNTNSTDNITPEWEGQFNEACSSSYPAKLQIYNRGGGGCTAAWEDVASSTSCSANTDFTLSGTVDTNLSCYYGTDTYIGSNTVALRVYKQDIVNGVVNLTGKTDFFSQNADLFTPGAETPTLEQLLFHGAWFDSSGVEQPYTF